MRSWLAENREVANAVAIGATGTIMLAALVIIGSRNLSHFDAALVAYTFATLFATFGILYRYSMWLQRPPTWLYFKRGWQAFLHRGATGRNLFVLLQRLVGGFALNNFIFRRGLARWSAHWLLMWGCILAVAITFPLVFGWIHFETVPTDLSLYRIFIFGFPTVAIPATGFLATMLFHGLVISSFLVIGGVLLAMRRRMRDHGVTSTQRLGEDVMPLLALFAISVTGLLLWISYTWMHGYAYDFLAILHAVTVILTFLWLPFGKFFHIFQRPAQVGVSFYKDLGARTEQAACRRCGTEFTSRMHVEDLIETERRLGYRYEMPGTDVEHYQWICPKCRRTLFALSQGGVYESSPDWSDYLRKEPGYHGHAPN